MGKHNPLISSDGNKLNNDVLSLIIGADYIPQMEFQSTGLVFMLACHAETNSSNCAGTAPVTATALVDTQTEHFRNHFLALPVYFPLIFISISANLLGVRWCANAGSLPSLLHIGSTYAL